jgi:hypothetical protein
MRSEDRRIEEIINTLKGFTVDEKGGGKETFFQDLQSKLNQLSPEQLEKIVNWIDKAENAKEIQWAIGNLTAKLEFTRESVNRYQNTGLAKVREFILSGTAPTKNASQFKSDIQEHMDSFKREVDSQDWESNEERVNLRRQWSEMKSYCTREENLKMDEILNTFKYGESSSKIAEAKEKIQKKSEFVKKSKDLAEKWKKIISADGIHDVSKKDDDRFTAFLFSEDKFSEAEKLLKEKEDWNQNETRKNLIERWEKIKRVAVTPESLKARYKSTDSPAPTRNEPKEFQKLKHDSASAQDSLEKMNKLISRIERRIEPKMNEVKESIKKLKSLGEELRELETFYKQEEIKIQGKKEKNTLHHLVTSNMGSVSKDLKLVEQELESYQSIEITYENLKEYKTSIEGTLSRSDIQAFRREKNEYLDLLNPKITGRRSTIVRVSIVERPWQKEIRELKDETNSRETKYEKPGTLVKMTLKKQKKKEAIEEVQRKIDKLLESGTPGSQYTNIIKCLEELNTSITEFEAATKLHPTGFRYGIFGHSSDNENKYVEKAKESVEKAKAALKTDTVYLRSSTAG